MLRPKLGDSAHCGQGHQFLAQPSAPYTRGLHQGKIGSLAGCALRVQWSLSPTSRPLGALKRPRRDWPVTATKRQARSLDNHFINNHLTIHTHPQHCDDVTGKQAVLRGGPGPRSRSHGGHGRQQDEERRRPVQGRLLARRQGLLSGAHQRQGLLPRRQQVLPQGRRLRRLLRRRQWVPPHHRSRYGILHEGLRCCQWCTGATRTRRATT